MIRQDKYDLIKKEDTLNFISQTEKLLCHIHIKLLH